MSATARIGTAMLIDDSEADRLLCRRIIARSGLIGRLLLFDYGEKALEHLHDPARDPVDVIFLDIRMPRMNGFEFLERTLEELGPGFVSGFVVMLTTSRDPQDLARARRQTSVADYLLKPLSVTALEATADRLAVTTRTLGGAPSP